MRSLNKYIKSIILIYEAIENPILQRFLEIDTNFNPNYEYEPIEVEPLWRKKMRNALAPSSVNSISGENTNNGGGYFDVSSLFLVEGDKMTKTKRRFEE